MQRNLFAWIPAVGILILLAICMPALAANLTTSTATKYRVMGVVKDALGRPLKQAALSLQGTSGRVMAHASSNDAGEFSFNGIARGTYAVVATKEGFKTATAIVCVANSNSGGSRGLKEAVAVSAPVIRIEACGRRRKCTAPLSRREPAQSGVTAIPVVIRLVGFQLELEIALAPKQCPVEKLSPYCPDQSLHESMRAGRAGNGLDLVDLEYPKVRQPAMKPEQRIVVG